METLTIWQKLGLFFKKNWKTTVGGILIALAGILFQSDVISVEVFGIIETILISIGFISAKDGDKTGT